MRRAVLVPLLAGAVAFVAAQAPTPLATFVDNDLGLTFSHPKTWSVARKTRGETRIQIPLDGTNEQAQLTVASVVYSKSAETWQELQVQINSQLKREVVRQWQTDILGVPMLYTQLGYSEGGVAKTALTGLLYARVPQKLLVRLTASQAKWDEALFAVQTALESLRTLDGTLPTPEDSNAAPIVKLPRKPPPPARSELTAPREARKPSVPREGVTMVFGERRFLLKAPTGWKAERTESGYRLTHAKLAGSVEAEFVPTTVETAAVALRRRAGSSLEAFRTVSLRQDRASGLNRGGGIAAAVVRTGTDTNDQPLFAVDGTISVQGFFVLLRYRGPADSPAVEELLEWAAIEAAP